MSFRNLEFVSPALNKAIQAYVERIDATQRDRELLYDIVGFAFDEGRIQGKEELINEKPINEDKIQTKEDI